MEDITHPLHPCPMDIKAMRAPSRAQKLLRFQVERISGEDKDYSSTMFRLLLLPLFLFTLLMACMGQTFQYSRGWTNGKRALNPPTPLLPHFHRSNELEYSDFYDLQEWSGEHKLERCLSLLHRSLMSINSSPRGDFNDNRQDSYLRNTNTQGRINNNNNDNVLFLNPNPIRHRQSNELLEELIPAGEGASAEPNPFGKH